MDYVGLFLGIVFLIIAFAELGSAFVDWLIDRSTTEFPDR